MFHHTAEADVASKGHARVHDVRWRSMTFSRGFHGRRRTGRPGARAAGQYVTEDFPVLSAGPTPHARSKLELSRSAGRSTRAELGLGTSSARCRRRRVNVDIHCVTKWSS